MRMIVMGALVMMAGSAAASTPAAWAQMDRQVTRACIAASGLKQAKIIADKASFSDRVPVERFDPEQEVFGDHSVGGLTGVGTPRALAQLGHHDEFTGRPPAARRYATSIAGRGVGDEGLEPPTSTV